MARARRELSAGPVVSPAPTDTGGGYAEDDRITGFNPWWFGGDWPSRDPHLRRLQAQPRRFPVRLVDEFDLTDPGVHVVRGPRQVGKSTDLKLLVERALREGFDARQVMYLALDVFQDQPIAAVSRVVERGKQLAKPDGSILLLLDEVTAVDGWQMAVKDLWDRGVIDRDVVVCTGSSAVDLVRGTAERLPGRRGAGRDHLVFPQPFDVFASAVDESLPPSPGLDVEGVFTDQGRAALRDVEIFGSRLRDAMLRYLHFGGLPAAVVEAATGAAAPSEAVQQILWSSLEREVVRKGASEPGTRALLERVVRSLGSKTSWSHMAKEMDVPLGRRSGGRPDHKTLRDYIEFLAVGYFLLIVYFWKRDADSSSVSRNKKVYFGDPLLHEAAIRQCCPSWGFSEPAMVENVVGLALYRKYEPASHRLEGFLDPSELHVWETTRGSEVDFVCGPRRNVAACEVKFQAGVDGRDLTGLKRAFSGSPIVVVTKDRMELGDEYALIPAHLFLWALG